MVADIRLGSTMTLTMMASTMAGNAKSTSSPADTQRSKRPPFHAVATARNVPTNMASTTTAVGPSSDERAPARMRENRSRPCESKPSG